MLSQITRKMLFDINLGKYIRETKWVLSHFSNYSELVTLKVGILNCPCFRIYYVAKKPSNAAAHVGPNLSTPLETTD